MPAGRAESLRLPLLTVQTAIQIDSREDSASPALPSAEVRFRLADTTGISFVRARANPGLGRRISDGTHW